MSNYEDLVVHSTLCNQPSEQMVSALRNIEKAVLEIREEMTRLLPQDNLQNKGQQVIRRLEIISLSFYVSILALSAFLFFYHDWYCAIGHNPCGQANLKCPWMKPTPQHQTCF
ncbi:unnamed protein product [Gongylonema pulchrum]|uniref:V-SNARE coiled-coil homology domain-containing protein n=1 Tax=Gongylonema pulchrum TaxID=637853 RepID=A0A183EHJ0_9BILA|nr:unnamed protein product [Gongylonema pulchrum]